MENIKTKKARRYFAAANSYHGFVSLFKDIFRSEEFTRIYVLKGGPGTGKSSFMKAMIEEFIQHNCDIDEIYCSSDPSSLDGIIIYLGDKKIAVLDGTAPHERDAVIPGVIDEIINLGEGWERKFLSAQRESVLNLAAEKAKAYATAYSYLKIAGTANDFIVEEYRKHFDEIEAKNEAERILAEISDSKNKNVSSRLISSFGKYGYYKIADISELCKKTVNLSGDDFSSILFIDCCLGILKKKGARAINFPSALDFKYSDGIIAEDNGLGIMISGKEGMCCDDFIKSKTILSSQTKCACVIREDALDAAKRWFLIASDFHFRLEEIYSGAMNFSINNEIIQQKITEIKKYLEINR